MAKGIDVFGTLNGTLGEKVYYRSGGEQKSRIRVRKPKNPQTSKQIFQRARFSSAGMFYAHGRQSFFPYAFEDKRAGESNFNAFMRNNIARAYPVSKSVVDNVAYPIINDWIVTKGSLPSLECYLHSADEGRTTGLAFDVPNYTNISSVNTIADLSRVLIATGDYDNKDIVTFLTILTDMRISTPAYGLYPEITPTEAQAAHWFIYQFNLNTADHTPLEYYRISATNILNNNMRINVWGPNTSWYADQLACGTIIHSRVKGSRTQVSTQQLVLSQTAQAQLYTYLAPNYSTYIDEVLANWRTGDVSVQIRPTEVLQGANSVNYDFTPEVEPEFITLTMNPESVNFTIAPEENDTGLTQPLTEIPIVTGDTLQVEFDVKLTGFSDVWRCLASSQEWTGEYGPLYFNEIGQRVMQNGWLQYFEESSFNIQESGIMSVYFDFYNTQTTSATYTAAVKVIRVTHANGSITEYRVQE